MADPASSALAILNGTGNSSAIIENLVKLVKASHTETIHGIIRRSGEFTRLGMAASASTWKQHNNVEGRRKLAQMMRRRVGVTIPATCNGRALFDDLVDAIEDQLIAGFDAEDFVLPGLLFISGSGELAVACASVTVLDKVISLSVKVMHTTFTVAPDLLIVTTTKRNIFKASSKTKLVAMEATLKPVAVAALLYMFSQMMTGIHSSKPVLPDTGPEVVSLAGVAPQSASVDPYDLTLTRGEGAGAGAGDASDSKK